MYNKRVRRFTLDVTCCSQHNFKSPIRFVMPNESEGNDSGQHDQLAKGWHNQGRQGWNQRRQGNRGSDQQRGRQARFEGREPRLQGHIYDWTGERTPERYIRTTREISTCVGVVYTKYTADFTAAVDTLDLADPIEPPAPDPANQVAFERWKYVYKEYMNKVQEYTNFQSGLYNLVMGQCSEALKERLKSHEDFLDANQNGIALLTLIRSLLHTFKERRKLADGLSDVKMAFYKLCRGKVHEAGAIPRDIPCTSGGFGRSGSDHPRHCTHSTSGRTTWMGNTNGGRPGRGETDHPGNPVHKGHKCES